MGIEWIGPQVRTQINEVDSIEMSMQKLCTNNISGCQLLHSNLTPKENKA